MALERRQFSKSEFPYHAAFALHQARKYEWLTRSGVARGQPEPWLLADTDTVFQCGAAEYRRRFRRFGVALLVGAESKWFPKRDYTHSPWPATSAARSEMRYPNSGLLLGTAAGFEELMRSYGAMRRFPCCALYARGKPTGRCHIDDQHCLGVALQQRDPPAAHAAAPWPTRLDSHAALPPIDFALDHNASLFLNLHGVREEELTTHRASGRCIFSGYT